MSVFNDIVDFVLLISKIDYNTTYYFMTGVI